MSSKKESKKPHINVSAALIFQNGSILITKRLPGYHLAGLWEFPGGKQEPDESLEECLEREIKEELDIEVRAEKLISTVRHEYEKKIVSLHFFNCILISGVPRAIECQEFKWIKPEDLILYDFPPPDKKIIELLTS
jgi:8-oxo-dGTP diphosphatase